MSCDVSLLTWFLLRLMMDGSVSSLNRQEESVTERCFGCKVTPSEAQLHVSRFCYKDKTDFR